jgi:hypothetical protein
MRASSILRRLLRCCCVRAQGDLTQTMCGLMSVDEIRPFRTLSNRWGAQRGLSTSWRFIANYALLGTRNAPSASCRPSQ